MSEPIEKKPKKGYERPEFTVYGTVQELTKSTGTHGLSDGGHVIGKTKTHA
jgi:hypothetical protein